MKRVSTLFFILAITPAFILAQDFGYLGKKNLFSVFTTSSMRITPAILGFAYTQGYVGQKNYRYRHVSYDDNNNLVEKFKLFRVDYRLAYQRIVTPKFALGAEFAYHKTTIGLSKFDTYDYYNNIISTASSDPVFRTMSYMLTAEFYNSKGIAGAGFSSQVGIGPKIYSFIDGENYRFSKDSVITNPYPVTDGNLIAINLFYELSYKMPITNSIFFNLGVRFHTGFIIPKFNAFSGTNTYYWEPYFGSNITTAAFEDNLTNLLSLKTGFTFVF